MDKTTIIEKAKEKLCYYDQRNPYNEINWESNDKEFDKTDKDCFCDNCFYGRTELAEIILELISEQQVDSQINIQKDEENYG